MRVPTTRQAGFTMTEVLIVLGIAGLIMLIVFLAVPGLQRNARNGARNREASDIADAATECLNDHSGNPNSCGAAAIQAEVDNLAYLTNVTVGTSPQYQQNAARVWYGSRCNQTESAAVTGGSPRAFTVTFQLEPSLNRCINSK